MHTVSKHTTWPQKFQMDDYEAPAMRFALDNEFEGGEFGVDGEFYAYGQKVWT